MNRSNKHTHSKRWIRLFYSILVNRFPALHARLPCRLDCMPQVFGRFFCYASLFPLLIGLFRSFPLTFGVVSYLVVHLAIVSSQLSFAVHHSVLLRIQHFPRRAILGTSSILQPYRSINRITHS